MLSVIYEPRISDSSVASVGLFRLFQVIGEISNGHVTTDCGHHYDVLTCLCIQL